MHLHRRRVYSAWDATFCVLAVLLIPLRLQAQEPEKRVLLLYDEDRTLPGLSILDQSLRSSFSAGFESDIEFFAESMNLSQFNDANYERVLRDYYANKYRDKNVDLVVGVMGPALSFLLRHGDTAFPGVPIIFSGADSADIQRTTLPPHATGLLLRRVFAPTLDIALKLQPETRHAVVIGGTSAFDRNLIAQARREFQPFEQRVSFEYLTDLSVADMLARVSQLPARSIILYLTFFRDGVGRTHVPHDVVSWISDAANSPVYIFMDQYLGRGAVGGHLYSIERLGTITADLGLQVLRGAPPATIPVRSLLSTTNMFDARQLARWRLDENLLPAHSTIRFREPTIWDRYGQYIIGGGVLLLAQTLLIAGLLLQRSSRRRAEMELRSSYEQIRSLSRRLLTAQEAERAHLSREIHDDISQQMVALQFDLQKLKNRLLGEDEVLASETSTRAASVTRSLRHLSHRLHPAHIRLVGLTGAVSDLGRELSTGDVSIAFLYDNVPDSLSPDVMLCFYRVAQEALSNALKHSQGSRVNIQIRGTAESLTMVIEDDGVGFDVTNAQRGLGLVSMRERVEQIGGSFRLRSLRAEGTQVQVHVPLSPAVPGDVTASGQSVTTV